MAEFVSVFWSMNRTDTASHDFEIADKAVNSGHAARGGVIAIAGQSIKTIVQLGGTVVLARILTPSDFGLVAMVTVITGFGSMFTDLGLSAATIQRPSLNKSQVDALFWLNVLLGLLLAILIAGCSPFIAWFYGEPQLLAITLAISTTFVLAGVAVQPNALLRRRLKFGTVTAITIASQAAGTLVAISVALLEGGAWALVAQTLTVSLFTTGLLLALAGWMPGLPRRDPDVSELVNFGAFVGAAGLLTYLRRNLDNVLIGAVYGAVSLGLYMKAYQLLTLPIRQINSPITQVMMPILSRLVAEPSRFGRFYCRGVFLIVGLSAPIAAFAAVTADGIVLTMLGEQWSDAVPLFLALIPAGLMSCLNGISSWVYLPMGRSNSHFKTQALVTVWVLGGILIGLPFGPVGAAWGFSASYSTSIPWVIRKSHFGTTLTTGDVWRAIWPAVFSSGFAAVTVLAVRRAYLVQVSPVFTLLISAFVFSTAYLLLQTVLPTRRNWKETIRIVTDGLPAHHPFRRRATC